MLAMLVAGLLPVAATVHAGSIITVNSTADPSPATGACPATCTLRNALATAQPGDTIRFSVAGTIHLSSTLVLSKDITIQGAGPDGLVLDGQGTVQVLVVTAGVSATLSDLAIKHGVASHGGGIFADGATLSLVNVHLTNNAATGSGGAINMRNGSLTIANSIVRDNGAVNGGGIRALTGTLVISNTTLSRNVAEEGGGGVVAAGVLTMTVTGSSFHGNVAGDGGALFQEVGSGTIINSTFSGNSASQFGNAIYTAGPLSISSSTVTDNGTPTPGLVTVFANDGQVRLRNTIVVGALCASDSGDGFISLGNNVSTTPTCTGPVQASDVITAASLLGPLADNGGPTQTHALLPGSPAIDAGSADGCLGATGVSVAVDQRGLPRVSDGNVDGSARCDVGAFEVTTPRLSVSSGPVTFAEGGAPVAVDQGLTLGDPSQPPVAEASVKLESGYVPGQDQLSFVNQNGISGSISVTSGRLTLTLTGNATLAEYQRVLRSVSYHNTAHPPVTDPRTIAITVQSADATTARATRQVMVVNSSPTAGPDAYSGGASTPLTVPGPGVLANDADVAGTHLTAVVASDPHHGTLALNADGGFTYTPVAGFAGTDTFTYRASDGSAQSQPATVTLTISPTACVPRPRVMTSPAAGGGKLMVRVEATPLNIPANNPINRIDFGLLQNAKVTANGQVIASGQSFSPPSGTVAVDFVVERVSPGQATTVPFTVVDGCGIWKSFVGGGTGAGF